MLEENKIQDIFKQASLKNEDWLEPSTMVFQNIEAAIYRRKRKRWLWFLLIFLLSITSVLTFLFYPQNNEPQLSNNKINEASYTEIIDKKTAKKTQHTGLIEKSKNTNDLGKDIRVNTSKLEVKNSRPIENSLIAKNQKSPSAKTEKRSNDVVNGIKTTSSTKSNTQRSILLEENEKQIKFNPSVKKNILTLNTVDEVLKNNVKTLKEDKTKINYIINNKSILTRKAESFGLINKPINKKNRTNNLNAALKLDKSVEKLPLIFKGLLANKNEPHNIKPIDSTAIDLPKKPITNWSFGFISGFSYWDYSINENLKSVLQPADFTYNNSAGYFVAVEAKKELSKKFSVIGSLGFETVYNKSGHNSTINYQQANENEEDISSYDIKMASTLGFVDANLQIQRQNNINIDSTPVTIDLNNSHQVSSIDFSSYLAANVFKLGNTKASMRLGLGVAQIIRIKNELTSFNTSLPALKSHKSEITANQNELNRTRGFIAFGADFTHQLSATNNLLLVYSFKSDFNALYQSGDLSTFLNKHIIGIGYQQKF